MLEVHTPLVKRLATDVLILELFLPLGKTEEQKGDCWGGIWHCLKFKK